MTIFFANGGGKQTAKKMTFELLNKHFCKRSGHFSFENYYGSMFESSCPYFSIKSKFSFNNQLITAYIFVLHITVQVQKHFRHADDEFNLHVKIWFKDQYW
jgi:hypothetical protein